MYIWTIPPTKQKKNVLSLRAAKGEENRATMRTTAMIMTTMLPRHRLYRNDIDSSRPINYYRRRWTAGRTTRNMCETVYDYLKTALRTRSSYRTSDSGGALTHVTTHVQTLTLYTYTHIHAHPRPLSFVHGLSQNKRYSLFFVVTRSG